MRDDPLGVRARVASALVAQALLLDADRVHLRALALIARAAPAYAGRPALGDWLDELVSRAIGERLRDEAAEGCAAGGAFEALARPLGLQPGDMARACNAFNRLGEAERRAFFALVIESRSLDEVARSSGLGASEIARRARRALDVILGTIAHVAACVAEEAGGAGAG